MVNRRVALREFAAGRPFARLAGQPASPPQDPYAAYHAPPQQSPAPPNRTPSENPTRSKQILLPHTPPSRIPAADIAATSPNQVNDYPTTSGRAVRWPRGYARQRLSVHPTTGNRGIIEQAGPVSTGASEESPNAYDSDALPTGEQARMTSLRRFQLEYEVESVGPAGVAEVELWATTNGARSWTRWGTDADHQSPFDVEVEEEGVSDSALSSQAATAWRVNRRVSATWPTSGFVLTRRSPQLTSPPRSTAKAPKRGTWTYGGWLKTLTWQISRSRSSSARAQAGHGRPSIRARQLGQVPVAH